MQRQSLTVGGKKCDVFLTNFYLFYSDKLYENPVFKQQILYHQRFSKLDSALSEREVFDKVLAQFLEEAESTLSLIKNINFTKKDMLGIGGGLGFVYGFLKKNGFNIYEIEPSESGFGGHYSAAVQLFKIIGVDKSHFYPLSAKECAKLNKQFDMIYSYYVLEHIPELEKSFSAMNSVLKPGGLMIHNTVNYAIPYEPHFKMMLFPFYPKLTELFKPSLRESSLWNGLNFITTHKLKNICKLNNLNIEFEKGVLQKTFFRLDSDTGFAEKQKCIIPIYKFLKFTRLIKIVNKIPIAFTTPITFTVSKRIR